MKDFIKRRLIDKRRFRLYGDFDYKHALQSMKGATCESVMICISAL
jgi:hypothetical protein